MHDIVFGEIYIVGLTNNYLSEYVHYNISEGCSHNYLSEYVHKFISEGCPQKQITLF